MDRVMEKIYFFVKISRPTFLLEMDVYIWKVCRSHANDFWRKKKLKVDFMVCYTYLFPFYLSVEHSAGFLIDSTSNGDIELKGSRDQTFRMNNIRNTDIFVLSIWIIIILDIVNNCVWTLISFQPPLLPQVLMIVTEKNVPGTILLRMKILVITQVQI